MVNPPEHCFNLGGFTGTIVKSVNDDRYLVRLDSRKYILRGAGSFTIGLYRLQKKPIRVVLPVVDEW